MRIACLPEVLLWSSTDTSSIVGFSRFNYYRIGLSGAQ